jgi:polar amino acid transport system substrate-binding protein
VAGLQVTTDADLHAKLPVKVRDAGLISIASSFPYPPWEQYVSGNAGDLTGIEADMMNAVGAKLGVQMRFDKVAFTGLVPAVQAGNADLVASALHATKERQQVLDFVEYLNVGSSFLVRKGNPEVITGMDSLCGHTLAVQASSAQLSYVNDQQGVCTKAGKPQITVTTFPDGNTCVLAVKSEQASAYFSDKVALSYAASTTDSGSSLEVVDDPTAKAGLNPGPVGVGVAKGNDEVRDSIRAALQKLVDDGTYVAILKKYGVDYGALEAVTVNGAAR